MNERIRELFNIATEYTESQDTGNISQVKLNNICAEKFTQLIVRECIDYCGENLSKTVGGALKIHFGVKE